MGLLSVDYAVFGSFLLLSIAASALFIIGSAHDRRSRMLLSVPFVASALIAMAAYLHAYGPSQPGLTLSLISASIFFTLAALCYVKKPKTFYMSMLEGILVVLCSATAFGLHSMAMIAALAIGGLLGIVWNDKEFHIRRSWRKFEPDRNKKHLEIKRDIFQILIGAVVILAILALGGYARPVVFSLVVLGLVYSNLISTNPRAPFGGFLASMERSSTTFGIGAFYLAMGVSLILGLVTSMPLVLLSLAALFFGDSAATIVGVLFGSIKLPYNRSKSVQGLFGYFAVVALFGYPIVGAYSIVAGLAFAVVESLRVPIDDNIAVAIFTVVISIISASVF